MVERQLQPDVAAMLAELEELGLPPMDSLPVEGARAFTVEMGAEAPPGPDVGEIVDGVFPGPAGDLQYRLYRPDSPGPHPIVVYFHGGGWVLGDHTFDAPFCQDICVRSDTIILSVNYRHAPEDRFPAAPVDGLAAAQWASENAESLGGISGQLAVAGWSAGANVAAVVCQSARDAGGPAISGQMLMTPATDCDLTRQSYIECAEGYFLTTSLMEWFWDHYADPVDRSDPRASPLRADDLCNLPPAFIVVSEFDVLRDEGLAYADALKAAGTESQSLLAKGHVHTSLTAVDVIESSVAVRAEIANELRGFFSAKDDMPCPT